MNLRCASLFLVLYLLLLARPSAGSILLPTNLTEADRQEALRLVGFGTSSKILSNPYPLGGYAGLEIGVSVENLSTEDLGRLGDGLSSPQQDVSFPKFTIGKGLYNNFDVFVNFTPYNRQDELSQYGGIIRWGFYQAPVLPLSSSLLIHANTGNIGNLMRTKSYGADLIGGINVDNVSLFAGFGVLEATGTFLGGSAGITDTSHLESETVSGFHTVLGANIHISNVFIAVQIDRYVLPVFSGKLGVRF